MRRVRYGIWLETASKCALDTDLWTPQSLDGDESISLVMVNTERKAARSFVVNYGRYAANIYYVLLLVGLFHHPFTLSFQA